jgi:hypothetical protein
MNFGLVSKGPAKSGTLLFLSFSSKIYVGQWLILLVEMRNLNHEI